MALEDMDADETLALAVLADRPTWACDELPPLLAIDMLRRLDERGLIEARSQIGDLPSPWHSPTRKKRTDGWAGLLALPAKNPGSPSPAVRVTQAARAALSRELRSVPAHCRAQYLTELRRALHSAIDAVRADPRLIREKKPWWQGGLNSGVLNGLARLVGLVEGVDAAAIIQADQVANERWTVVHHTDPERGPLRILTWSPDRLGLTTPGQLDLVREYLEAWLQLAGTASGDSPAAVKDSKTERSPLAELKELEASTPPLNREDGSWVTNRLAAQLENLKAGTLRTYRNNGIRTDCGSLGRDSGGRVWRRQGTEHSHPWYLKTSLRAVRRQRRPQKP